MLAPLLVGTVAVAQPQPAPGERQMVPSREVSLPTQAGPAPVVRVAPRVRTYIAFDAPINPESVKLEGEGTRVRLADVGTRTIAVEGLTELDERGVVLRATYADGMAPQVATLTLVSEPGQVDKEVQVNRRPLSCEAMEADLDETRARFEAQSAELAALRARCEASGPVGLVFAGVLDWTLKQKRLYPSENPSGLDVRHAWATRTAGWMVAAAWVRNTGNEPWSPGTARLTVPGEGAKVLPVRMKGGPLAPGETGLVAVEVEQSPPEAFRLEWLDAQGRPVVSFKPVNFYD